MPRKMASSVVWKTWKNCVHFMIKLPYTVSFFDNVLETKWSHKLTSILTFFLKSPLVLSLVCDMVNAALSPSQKSIPRHATDTSPNDFYSSVSSIWASLTWLRFLIRRLVLISPTAPAASKMALTSKLVKIDSKIIISHHESKSVTHSVC